MGNKRTVNINRKNGEVSTNNPLVISEVPKKLVQKKLFEPNVTSYSVFSLYTERDIDGNHVLLSEHQEKDNLIFAKKVESTNTVYFIRILSGKAYNPYGGEKIELTKMKSVKRQVFEFYLGFLRTHDSFFLRSVNKLLGS